MEVKDSTCVILAAGKGNRMGNMFGSINKTLLKVYNNHTIMDILLYELISEGIRKIIIICGHNAADLIDYVENLRETYHHKELLSKISDKFLRTEIISIKARHDFQKGPFFTLMTLNQYITPHSAKKNIELFKPNSDFITVIPSDTIFNRKILHWILSTEIILNKNQCNGTKIKNQPCHLFALEIKHNKLKKLKETFHFSCSYIKFKKSKWIGVSKYFEESSNEESKSSAYIQVPMVILPKEFITFGNMLLKTGITTIIDALQAYNEIDENVKTHKVTYQKMRKPPFFDIDSKTEYENIRKLGKIYL
ncbi:MAG: sugar phosphate nucleotidyltransferase [Promethearchaeota archaeon]